MKFMNMPHHLGVCTNAGK